MTFVALLDFETDFNTSKYVKTLKCKRYNNIHNNQ